MNEMPFLLETVTKQNTTAYDAANQSVCSV